MKECTANVGAVLTDAEYMDGVAERIRDLSLPFDHERDSRGASNGEAAGQQNGSPQPKRAGAKARFHAYLVKRRFKLGEATYLISQTQTNPRYVTCYRQRGKVSNIVTLTLLFVMEQLAERIELEATNF